MTQASRHDTCSVCGTRASTSIFAVERVPIHPFCPPAELGIAPGYGELDIVTCDDCGHIYNAAFNASRVDDLYAASVLTNTPVSESMIRGLELTAEYILSRAPRDAVVADVGGGTGVLSRTLARRAKEVHLIEPSRALKVSDFAGSGVTLHQSMFPAPTLGDRMFDAIVSRQVIEHIPDPRGFLTALRSRLKETGVAYIECPSAEYIEDNTSIVDFHYPHVHYFRQSAMAALLAEAGFEILDTISIKDGHDQGFLLEAAKPRPATKPASLASGDFAARLACRRTLAAQKLEALGGGLVALYGANAYSQALLGLYPTGARYSIMLDDTPIYEGQRAYGPGIDIAIRRPGDGAFDGISAVVVTSYLHDVVIARKVRGSGFTGPIFTVRTDALAGRGETPPSLFG